MNEVSPIQKAVNFVGSLSLSRVAILAGVLTVAYYALIFDSGDTLTKQIEAGKVQLVTENAKKIETQKVLKKEQQMKADVDSLAQKYEEIKAQIPIDFLESDLRMIVDQYASQNNLKTTRTNRIQLKMKVDQANHGHENLIEQIALGYEFEGTYNNIAKFVSQISSVEKLIKIGDFDLSVMSQAGKKGHDLLFKVNIIGFKQSLEALNNANAVKKATP